MDQSPRKDAWPWIKGTKTLFLQAAIFGTAFGFLLQKGGVAKFDILIGVLLLENFVVIKVMASAVVTGMIGVYFLHRFGRLQLQVKETVLKNNVLGGLLFGIGFGMIAYCPGTNAAAVGQGNLDAIAGICGMTFGAYLYALASRFSLGRFGSRGEFGKMTLPELFGLSRGTFVMLAASVMVVALAMVELYL